MLAKIKAINPRRAPIFKKRLIFLKSFLSRFLLNERVVAYITITKPKIIEMRKKMGLVIGVKIGKIKKIIAQISAIIDAVVVFFIPI